MRNLTGIALGVVLSFVLSLIGSWLTRLWIIGNVDFSENKDAIVRLMLLQTFVLAPAVAIIVGAFVASIVQRPLWWLGGLSMLPLLVYGFVRGGSAIHIGLSGVYVLLALASAFLISRLKREPQI